jgi:hypothetical protein
LFSHAEMVADLLKGYVREEWVQDLDFSTLEKVNDGYVSEDLRRREDDMVWRVRLGPRWVYVYLLLGLGAGGGASLLAPRLRGLDQSSPAGGALSRTAVSRIG